jgi:5-methylcytosine-specific restriction endonuclease McrA
MSTPSPSLPPIQLRTLKDAELIASTQRLVREERSVTMSVLRHLAEIERRKLYADYQCGSLFDYAVRELKYSEASAARRVQAVRLLAEIPEVAPQIESGALNLSNVCQAQSFFREQKKAAPERVLRREEKKEILQQLEQKSAREGQRLLLAIGGPAALPRERERVVSSEHTEVRFLVNAELKAQLETVRSLLGSRGVGLSLAELVSEMARLSCERLEERRFGKQRVRAERGCEVDTDADAIAQRSGTPSSAATAQVDLLESQGGLWDRQAPNETLGASARDACVAPQERSDSDVGVDEVEVSKVRGRVSSLETSEEISNGRNLQSPPDSRQTQFQSQSPSQRARTRYIAAATKHQVWREANGKCTSCGSAHHLQFDHAQPFALGGDSSADNLRLLCRSCNLRRGVKTFGAHALRRDR